MGLFSRKEKITLLDYCPNCNDFTSATLGGKCKACNSDSLLEIWISRTAELSIDLDKLEESQKNELFEKWTNITDICQISTDKWNELDEVGKELRRIEAQELFQSVSEK